MSEYYSNLAEINDLTSSLGKATESMLTKFLSEIKCSTKAKKKSELIAQLVVECISLGIEFLVDEMSQQQIESCLEMMEIRKGKDLESSKTLLSKKIKENISKFFSSIRDDTLFSMCDMLGIDIFSNPNLMLKTSILQVEIFKEVIKKKIELFFFFFFWRFFFSFCL